jgi:hypothetical protein
VGYTGAVLGAVPCIQAVLGTIEFEDHAARENQEDLLGVFVDVGVPGGPARCELCDIDLEIA